MKKPILTKKLSQYSTTAGAAIGTGITADAAIVTNSDLGLTSFFVLQNQTITWDLNNDGTDDFQFVQNYTTNTTTTYITPSTLTYTSSFGQLMATGSVAGNGFATGGGGDIGGFSTGQLIGSGNVFNNNAIFTTYSYGFFAGGISSYFPDASGDAAYIGFQFQSTGNTLYGWALVDPERYQLEVIEWAFEDSGAAIQVGATSSPIPEPAETAAGLGLLALGAAGLHRYRKQRKA